tara:strand:+ start:197 stop:1162 length:966 start_codon:yes stop_codon:yes gene_type:complete
MENNEQNIIQNHSKIIQCERCSSTFANMTNLRRHFNNKKKCKSVLKDIPIEDLIEKYKVRKGCYKCENCGKEYKTSDGKYKHKKKCMLNIAIIQKNENEILREELELVKVEKEVLEEELEKKIDNDNDNKIISSHTKNSINNNNINNNGTLNNGYIKNNVVVNINNYGIQTEMTKKEITKIINLAMKLCNDCSNNPWKALNYVLQEIHFNRKYPENQNLKVKNFSSPVMDVYKEGKWRKVPFREQIRLVIESLMDFINDNQDKVDFSSNYWEELNKKLDEYLSNGDNKKYYKKVETSLKCKLYNETIDMKGTQETQTTLNQ